MKINKIEREVILEVGDILELKDSKRIEYFGHHRAVFQLGSDERYNVVILDNNSIQNRIFYSIQEIYEYYKDNIVRIIKANDIELLIKNK